MNPEDFSRDDLLPNLSPIVAGIGCLVALVLWILRLRAPGRLPALGPAWHLIGFVVAASAFWLAFQCSGQFISYATSWPLWALAVAGAFAAEIIVLLYGFEKTLVRPVRGRWLLGLRLTALLVLILILAQPVLSFLESREIEREIAILVDESDSMLLADQRLSATEILDRAELLEVEAAQNRPPLGDVRILTENLEEQLGAEISALSSAPSLQAGLEGRAEQLPETFVSLRGTNTALQDHLDQITLDKLPGDVRNRVEDYKKRTRDGLPRIFTTAEESANKGNANELSRQLQVAREEIRAILETLPTTLAKADEAFYQGLGEDVRNEVNLAAATPRLELAREILNASVSPQTQEGEVADPTLSSEEGLPLWEALQENYNLRLFRFDREITQMPSPEEGEWAGEIGSVPTRAQTDLTGALEYIIENTAPESLAGVLLLSDGRHNGGLLPEDSLRQLAVQNTPLSAVPIGGKTGPVDISLLNLRAPESIYLDDRVVVSAEAKLDGMLGKKVKAELVSNEEVVDTIEIDVTDVNFRTEIRFVHRPEEKGILDYKIRLEPDEREIFQNNNEWDFKIAVTDDRTNVLLVDSYPRWEFRYLRNLFYGRDKSVHLQYVLLNPDEIHRGRRPQPTAASATRKFGEATATMLPQTSEEWQLFDVIILGDIAPGALTLRDWNAIEEAVNRRGALLVCVAGARHMPHGFENETLQSLLPITYTPTGTVQLDSPEKAYHIELTSAGQSHSVTSQSTSRSLNQERWAGFQKMRWRFQPDGVKETAEVLAYARPEGAPAIYETVTPDSSPGSVEAAIERLANRKELERENALISTIRAGLGKVLMLNFDETWRFRYGVGDTYHHRFWGQVTRWGAGDNLRSGNELVRLGSDRLSYTPNDSIEVTAKILDAERRPIMDADVDVEMWRNDERIGTQKMSYRSESSGIYETSLGGLSEEGEYELRLVGDDVEKSLQDSPDAEEFVSTELLVVTTRNPVELAELTSDREFLKRATSLTGGEMVELGNLDALLTSFGAPKETLTERRNITLWDTWPLLLTFLGVLTTEWILRRRSGLV